MRVFLFSVLLCFCGSIFGQLNNQFGLLPSFNLNYKITSNWKLNLRIESRQLLKQADFYVSEKIQYDYLLTDIATVASKKVGLNNNIAGGYLIRFREKQLVHRSIQQFTLVKKYVGLRLAHRFSTDQTFTEGESAEFRFRYRIALELPLNGQSVDPKEFYIKLNHEYLIEFQSNKSDLEVRIVPFLGYQFSHSNKLEAGLDYRVDSFEGSSTRRRSWISLNWYVSLQ